MKGILLFTIIAVIINLTACKDIDILKKLKVRYFINIKAININIIYCLGRRIFETNT